MDDLSVQEWLDLFKNKDIFKDENMLIMRRFLDIGGAATCSQLSGRYGKAWGYYNSMCSKLAKRISEEKNIELERRDDGSERRWPVLFTGKNVSHKDDVDGSFLWILKPNLKAALEQVDLSKYEPLYENEVSMGKNEIAQEKLNDFFKSHFWGKKRIISSKSKKSDSYYIPMAEDESISLWYEWWKDGKETYFAISVDFDSEDALEKKAKEYNLNILKEEKVWNRDDVVFNRISYQGQKIGPRGGKYDEYAYMTQYIPSDYSWEEQEICLDRFFNHPFVRENNQFKELVAQRIVANMNKKAGETSLRLVDEINPIKRDKQTLYIQYKPSWANESWSESGFHYEFRVTDKEIYIEFHSESKKDHSISSQTGTLPFVFANWFDGFIKDAVNRMIQLEKKFGNQIIEIIGQKELVMMNKAVELLKNNHNIILHGAPGTGKTYLAKEVAKAMGCTENEISFVQFHQSYDYTDFVEGLRPVNQESNQIGFERKDGVFKEFCIKAMIKSSSDSKTTGKLNSNPVVWKVSLAGTGDNPIRQDCLENGYIRIGWKEYGDVENFNDFDNYINGGKNVLRAFQNEMKEGDIVVSCFSENETDAIGIVTGSYNYDEIRFGDYPRFRNVEWLVKNIKEDIVAINNNRKFTLSTIYKSNITAEDAIKIVNKHKTSISLNDRPFVFIIDEINRGEMSKIFGELFFSIDPGYRGEMGRIKTQYQNLVPNGDVFAKGFFVPKNVYIIGTMNDIDRSVESMDFAMRRRFAFKEIKAEDRIAMLKDPENGIGEYADKAEKRMNALNEAIGSETVGLSHAYDIGPAYFLKLKDCDYSFDKLWDYHIKGLVKEYLRGMDENGEKFKALKDAYFHSETNAPKKEESESK